MKTGSSTLVPRELDYMMKVIDQLKSSRGRTAGAKTTWLLYYFVPQMKLSGLQEWLLHASGADPGPFN